MADKIGLCDCKDECSTHPTNRLYHINDECVHADGTRHKINKITKL